MKIVVAMALLYVCTHIRSDKLRIAHYANVTLRMCGLNAFSAKPAHKKCLEWHQSVEDELKAIRNIENGRDVQNGEFPYAVLIKVKKQSKEYQCTGSVINGLWIITAAHCLDMYPRESDTTVFAGISDYADTKSGNYYKASKYFLHESYSINTGGFFDIALIKLEKAIALNISKVNGVCLPARNMTIFRTELATFTGWGAVSDTQVNEQRLKMTQIKLGDIFVESKHSMIDTFVVRYGKLCAGDSGGPLVQYVNGKAVLIGISQGAGGRNGAYCGQSTSISFTSIPYYLGWIIEKIKNN